MTSPAELALLRSQRPDARAGRRIARRAFTPRSYRVYTRKDIDRIPQLQALSEAKRETMKVVSTVLPFRVNNYVIEDLIDWSAVPDDPIYQLTFPQAGMLAPRDFARMQQLLRQEAPRKQLEAAARQIQRTLNPQPAGQVALNVPELGGEPVQGVQHKYRETLLFFPAAGQTCHAYCMYCFRWAQFAGIEDLKFAARDSERVVAYLRAHPEVTNVLITGGDPMVMTASVLRRYIEPLLQPGLEQLESIRIGTKAPAYWPYRFVTDPDADELLRLLERISESGRHLALMAHYSHPRELEEPVAGEAIRRLRGAGAVIRCQTPLIRHVNDSAACWSEMWRSQVRLGAVPYYMFVERDTGPKNYFRVPLARALQIFGDARRGLSGLGRTARGPSMSTTVGKVLVEGVAKVRGEEVFVLKLLQARDPEWVGRVFFARYDPDATWLDELRPAFGERDFFFGAFTEEPRPSQKQEGLSR